MCIIGKEEEKEFVGSRSFKVIDVDTPKSPLSVLVMICSMFVPICNRFHATRVNNGNMRIFRRGYP